MGGLSKYTKAVIILIIIGAIIRLGITLITNEGGDPAWHLSVARFTAINFKIPLFEFLGREVFANPPLFHLLGAFFYNIFKIFGESAAEFGLKMVSLLSSIGVLIFTYLLTKELTNRKIAFYATLFISFLPMSIYYSVTAHLEMLNVFCVLLTIYFLVKKKIYFAAVFAGLSLMSRINGFFITPIILFYLSSSIIKKRISLKKIIIFLLIIAAIALPWYLRNYIILGNPIWPMMNSLIGTKYVALHSFRTTSLSNLLGIFDPKILLPFYLDLFGVPVGAFQYFSLLKNIPFIKLLLPLWYIITAIFLTPFIFSFSKSTIKHKNLILVWIFSFIFVSFLALYQYNVINPRYFFQAFPAIAIFWGIGFSKLLKFRYGKIILIIFILISAGFVCSETIKAKIISDQWAFYEDDFKWVQENTPKDTLILTNSQALSYKLKRAAIYNESAFDNLIPEQSHIPQWYDFPYIFINQKFKIDPDVILDENLVKQIKKSENFTLVYSNNVTGTEIYKNKNI